MTVAAGNLPPGSATPPAGDPGLAAPIAATLVPHRRAVTLALLTLAYFFSYMDRQILGRERQI